MIKSFLDCIQHSLILSPTDYRKRTKQKKERHLSYYHYSSLAPLGRLRATDEGTLDKRDSNAHRVWVQKTSIASFVKSALYLDPSNSNSSSSSGKRDKTVVSGSQHP
jgi:hypothetical protein